MWIYKAHNVSKQAESEAKNFCILALGSGQRLLYRLGSGIGLVSVLVLQFCGLKLIFKLISGKEGIVLLTVPPTLFRISACMQLMGTGVPAHSHFLIIT